MIGLKPIKTVIPKNSGVESIQNIKTRTIERGVLLKNFQNKPVTYRTSILRNLLKLSILVVSKLEDPLVLP